MKRIIIGIFNLLIFSTLTASGQQLVDSQCNRIFDDVAGEMKPTHIFRREIYTSDCDFDFTAKNGSGLLITVETYGTEKETKEAIKSDLALYKGSDDKTTAVNMKTEGFWDEAILYNRNRTGDGFILLRRQKFLISLFSLNDEVLLTAEKTLRKVKFMD